MADKESFGGGAGVGVGVFSPLPFADDALGFDMENYTSSLSDQNKNRENTPTMLCFGSSRDDTVSELVQSAQKLRGGRGGGVTCSDSSSCTKAKSHKKRTRSRQEPANGQITGIGAPVEDNGSSKKSRAENPSPKAPHAKVRKEKLGERILALQQLVSPFGKTDTASVLHEAMGYIKFLHDQVQVLCSPYLQRLSSSSPHPQFHQHLSVIPEEGREDDGENESKRDLRSRGLILVPAASTVHVANTNGADFWSSAMVNSISPIVKQ